MADTDTVFGLNFDELIASVGNSGGSGTNPAPAQPAPAETAPEDTASAAADPAPAGHELTFDEMVAQAQKKAAVTASEEEAVPATVPSDAVSEQSAPSEPTKEPEPAAEGVVSFDSLVAKAQASKSAAEGVVSFDSLVAKAQAGTVVSEPAETNAQIEAAPAPTEVQQATADTAPSSFDEMVAKAEASAQEKATDTAETKAEVEATKEDSTADPSENKQPKDEEKEVPKEEKPKRTRKSRSKKNKEEPKAEDASDTAAPEDITENYRVDVLGTGTVPKETIPETGSTAAEGTTMETLFSPEEVAAIRKDIRTFVRKELKLAMVDAMKELLNDFSH